MTGCKGFVHHDMANCNENGWLRNVECHKWVHESDDWTCRRWDDRRKNCEILVKVCSNSLLVWAER